MAMSKQARIAINLVAALIIAQGAAGLTGCVIQNKFANQLDRITNWWILIGGSAQTRAPGWQLAAERVELVVLNDHPRYAIEPFGPKTIRLAYLSLGEVEFGRPYWPAVAGSSYLVEINPDWEHNVRVDIRDPRWQGILLEQEAPRLMDRGYDGFMLDTLDIAAYLEKKDPVRFAGSRQALRKFLSELRRAFPNAYLLANATEGLLDAAPFVDGYVVESVFATYDLVRGGYRETTSPERTWRLAQVNAALASVRRPVFSIEYASFSDAELAAWAISEARRHGFKPTVTTRSLDQAPH